ncbi:glycosyltransferase family 2 protein [Niastella sp. OAS944]|uniref:glycosyltransferase family 2 protein n=1 Tax=Niastella sp. OAS944 TaxID=2664089 RepID=UPI00346D97AE
MKVHIGITSKNRFEIIPKAIQSALDQTYTEKVITIFDDASSDATPTLAHKYPQVNWIISDIPRGYLYARNHFLEISDAELFASLDDDSWFMDNDALKIAIDHFKKDKSIGAIAFEIVGPENPDTPKVEITPVVTHMYIGCGHLLNVEAVKKVGAYIPTPGLYGGEEKDLCIRLMDAGYKIILLKGLYVWHDKTSVARNIPFQHRSGVCNDLIFAYRRTPAMLLIPFITVKLWKLFKFSYSFKEVPLLKPFFKGFGDFFKCVLAGKTKRKAVSMKTFKHYLQLK